MTEPAQPPKLILPPGVKRPEVLVPDRYTRSDKRIAYAQFWTWMYPHAVRAVERSFVEANMLSPTEREVKHRIDLAKKIVDELRQDAKWSKFRIRDELPRLLREKLLGVKTDLDKENKRAAW